MGLREITPIMENQREKQLKNEPASVMLEEVIVGNNEILVTN